MQLEKEIMPGRILSHPVATSRFRRAFSFKSSEFNKNRHIVNFLRHNPTSSNNDDDDDGKKNAAGFTSCMRTIN